MRKVLQNCLRCSIRYPLNILNASREAHTLAQSATRLEMAKLILVPNNTNILSMCGFKVKGFLKRRCKDCYFIMRQNRLHVLCKTHPRHKQMQVQKKEKNTLILSHATQSKVRPW